MDAPTNIEVADRSAVTLTWADGPATLTARQLRAACVCADCRSDAGIVRTQQLLGSGRHITIEGAELRGAYAITFVFGPDGHGTGIFSWDLLRSLSEPEPDATN